jgi:3-oxoadipate enol-lactonase/4-carboxymuconolactone decarboxylase
VSSVQVTGTDFGGAADAPLLLVGPSLGTSVTALWGAAADGLVEQAHVVGWDLPGHGDSPTGRYRIPDLAAAVFTLADELAPGAPFHYAGVSLGGAVGIQLLLDAPERLLSATLLCTAAEFGPPEEWISRAAAVRTSGTHTVIDGATQRWFAAGFVSRHPEATATLLNALRNTDDESYAQGCEAIADFDLTDRLGEVVTPVLAIAGMEDVPTPPESAARIASGVKQGRLVLLERVGHLAPIEAPHRVAELIADHLRGNTYTAGMAVRRTVLGDAHVDQAIASSTEFTAEFQEFITRYAWGTIWTRPGLDRRSRSLITLTALIAQGHHEELRMHLRAARRNGLAIDEIKELLLQTAIYCGVPAANTAFRVASQVFAGEGPKGAAR